MVALHVWSLSHGIASLFARADQSRRKLPMSPEELLEAGRHLRVAALVAAAGGRLGVALGGDRDDGGRDLVGDGREAALDVGGARRARLALTSPPPGSRLSEEVAGADNLPESVPSDQPTAAPNARRRAPVVGAATPETSAQAWAAGRTPDGDMR